jgi:hypothetical protein
MTEFRLKNIDFSGNIFQKLWTNRPEILAILFTVHLHDHH